MNIGFCFYRFGIDFGIGIGTSKDDYFFRLSIGRWDFYKWSLFKRSFVHFWQRIRWGFDDSDLWSLCDTFTKFILPRLKRFVDSGPGGYPGGPGFEDPGGYEKWVVILNKMVRAFELMEADEFLDTREERNKRNEEIQLGLKYFAKYYQQLWD